MGSHRTIAMQERQPRLRSDVRQPPLRLAVSRGYSAHMIRKGLRLRHILEFRHGADPFLQTIVCGHISVIQRAGACSDRKIRLTFSEPALVGAVDRCSVAVNHLSRGAMATAPHSHATRRLHDQSIECGNFRGSLSNVQGGSVHVHAEHDRESRSEARAGQSMNVYFHSTFPLFFTRPKSLR
jgi:hypothetical protein